MSAANNNIPIDGADRWRDQERRMQRQEARPGVTQASDILGPGIAPLAVQLQDWSSEEGIFNGFYYSQPTALNTPDTTKWWLGQTLGTDDGYGTQQVREFRGAGQPGAEYIREFAPGGAGTQYGPWTVVRQSVSAGTIASTGPGSIVFGGVSLRKSGGIVYVEGSFTRPAGFSTTYVVEGQVLAGFEPARDFAPPASPIHATTTTWQWVIHANGSVEVRMSAAIATAMSVGGMSYIAATP